jgi:protein O-GlcNAc transferase
LYKLHQFQESISQFDKLLLLQPNHIAALNERGSVLAEMCEYDAALASFEKALMLLPQYPEAHLNRANVYGKSKRYSDALAAYDEALALNPELAEAWLGRGKVLSELKRFDKALAAYDKALAIKPDLAGAWLGRGNIFAGLRRYNDAFAAYHKAFAIDADLEYAEGARFYTKMQLCDWSNFESESAHLTSSVRRGTLTSPFGYLALPTSPEEQLQCARLYGKRDRRSVGRGDRYNHDKIRVAYISADIRQHAVTYLIAGLIESHNKERFDVTGISLQPEDPSDAGQRMKRAFGSFTDVSGMTDEQIAQLIRKLEIDIAIDLMGFTQDARTNVFAQRPAPIQVNYLGFPGTMGTTFIDYIIADKIVIPNHMRKFYSEKIVYMPHSFQANDRQRLISETLLSRVELGLPHEGFVFCCFNHSYKITPFVFDIWMRILNRVDNSVLWLLANDAVVQNNLRKEAVARGINPERLVFAPSIPYPEHLARLSAADLFLDTTPFNAGATASDALWSNLPVLTRIGDCFAGRMAASVLNAIGLPELITSTAKAYEDLAVELATAPEQLAAIKRKLANNRLTTPLFNTQQFAHHIEAAYTAMYERYQKNLPPHQIYVSQ